MSVSSTVDVPAAKALHQKLQNVMEVEGGIQLNDQLISAICNSSSLSEILTKACQQDEEENKAICADYRRLLSNENLVRTDNKEQEALVKVEIAKSFAFDLGYF